MNEKVKEHPPVKSWRDRHGYISDQYEGPPPTLEELEKARGTFRLFVIVLAMVAVFVGVYLWR